MPENDLGRPWIYAGAQPAVNQYPTTNKPLATQWNPAAEFTKLADMNALNADIPNSFTSAISLAGPAGQDEKLQTFKEVMEKFGGADYEARETIYNDPEQWASKRIACDPRLEEVAKECYENAFDEATDVFLGTICADIPGFNGFDYADIRQRQIDSGSGIALPVNVPNQKNIGLDLKESIIANTVLQIEHFIEQDLSTAIREYIPPAYTFFRSNKRVCDQKCPVPSEWSPWTCHCSKSGQANPDNLVDCQCGSQTRSRIQTCTTVEGISCEIYHDGLTPFTQFGLPNYDGAAIEYEDKCASYGYANFLDNIYKFDGKVYHHNRNLKSVIDYLGNGTEASLMKWYPGSHAEDQCFGSQVVSEAMFKSKLADPNLDEFTFALEEDTCASTNVLMRVSETECTKTCGCGTYTKSWECVYKGGDNDGEPVPVDSEDYTCGCTPKDDEIIACNTQCCPVWHECDNRDCNILTPNWEFSIGKTFKYEACDQECGEQIVEGELRCMCDNRCLLDYDDNVKGVPTYDFKYTPILEILDVESLDYTEHDWKKCEAGVKTATDDVTDMGNNAVDYRITRDNDCEHPCCVRTVQNNNNCPALDCFNTEFSMPWNINYDT